MLSLDIVEPSSTRDSRGELTFSKTGALKIIDFQYNNRVIEKAQGQKLEVEYEFTTATSIDEDMVIELNNIYYKPVNVRKTMVAYQGFLTRVK
jgi:hypothetical protein